MACGKHPDGYMLFLEWEKWGSENHKPKRNLIFSNLADGKLLELASLSKRKEPIPKSSMLDLYFRVPQSHKVAPPDEVAWARKGGSLKAAMKWLNLHTLCLHPGCQALALVHLSRRVKVILWVKQRGSGLGQKGELQTKCIGSFLLHLHNWTLICRGNEEGFSQEPALSWRRALQL